MILFGRLHLIGIGLLFLGFAMIPINYTARIKTYGNTDEVSYRLKALTTRITQIDRYSLDRNDVELVAREIEEASEILAKIRQSNNHPASIKNLSFMFYAGLTVAGSIFLILASWQNQTTIPKEE